MASPRWLAAAYHAARGDRHARAALSSITAER
jgi:hypothetical protein